jgi:hypothetical protein
MAMPNVNIWNSMRTPVRIKVFSPVTENLSESPDIVHENTRYLTTMNVPNDYTLAPRQATQVDAGFWSTFQSQSATSTLLTSHVIYQVP